MKLLFIILCYYYFIFINNDDIYYNSFYNIIDIAMYYGSVAFIYSITFLCALLCAKFAHEWFIVEKAGEHGWKVIIPFYRNYILGKIAKHRDFAIIYSFTEVLLFFMFVYAFILLLNHGNNKLLIIFISTTLIINIILNLILWFNLCKKFGKNSAFGVFFCIFMIIFPIISYFLVWYLAINCDFKPNSCKTL